MSVETLLGLGDDRMAALAASRWPDWLAVEPRLERVTCPAELARWRRHVTPAEANGLLLGLARLAAFDGEDDRDAALVLAWLLLPTALKVCRHYGGVGVRVDDVIAAELWLVVRTLEWRKRHWVAAKVAIDLREAVLVESGISTRRHPVMRTASVPVDLVRTPDSEPDAAEILSAMLEWARVGRVIAEADHLMMVSLIAVARSLDDAGQLPRNNGAGGLASESVTRVVAEQLGVCQRTIRRRTVHCMRALAAARGRFLEDVSV